MARKATYSEGPPQDGGFIRSVRFVEEEAIDWDRYPFNLPAVLALPKQKLQNPVTIFVGENGTGKSTIIEGLAAMLGMNPEGGAKGMNFSTASTHSMLWDFIVPNRNPLAREGYCFFLRAETMYNVFTESAFAADDFAYDELFENPDLRKEDGTYIGPDPHLYRRRDKYANAPMHQMSHGESFFAQLSEFRPNGLYILDEPEAALSPNRQLAAVKLMHDLAYKKGCQIFMATHSPILLSIPGAKILQLTGDGIEEVEYEDTDLYRTYWAFLKSPKAFLDRLLAD
ncbi:MAG: AAA family ATPase [Armatimonadetes bacterium]|nr:AAA family ATPase [Armatimonadota bacterium]